ncbi:hypothetical protein [Microbacterium sp. A93]|uniref:hypothetical protein n=1 Tax=Microbacterium sp. A93 TaxID=3450716 RepID=UPI003F430DA3
MNAADTPGPDAGTRVDDPLTVAGLYEHLLVPNFPASELITAAELVESVAAGTSTVRVIGAPEDPLAIAVTESFARSPAVLLGYFATRADQRGRGIGSALLTGLLAGIAAEEPEVSVVLAEVEHPAHHPVHAVHGDPAARLRFYGRLGGHILDLPYVQPPVDASQEPVYGMLLLALAPPARYVRGDRLLPEAGLAGALEEILAGADPERLPVAAALAAARHPRGTRLIRVADLDSAPVALKP